LIDLRCAAHGVFRMITFVGDMAQRKSIK
jgi:hypothetical protein